MSRRGKSVETEGRLVVDRAGRVEGWLVFTANGYKVSFRGSENYMVAH